MLFKELKAVETLVYLDAETHEVVTEVFLGDLEDPITSTATTPRELVEEMVESGDYTDDQLDMFLDTLYSAIAILEKHLNGNDDEK